MNKLLICSAALIVSAVTNHKKVYAWFGNTHKDILEKALRILNMQDDKKYYDFFIEYKDILLKACTEPDNKGDTDKGSGLHYYCAANKRGIALENISGYFRNRHNKFNRTARTMLEENYTMALSLYKSGDKKAAIHRFGRALHFIQDIGCTVHSSGIMYMDRKKNPHYAFEKLAQTIYSDVEPPQTINKQIKKSCETSIEQAVNKLSMFSSGFAADVRKVDRDILEKACRSTLPVAQQYTACMMMRFYNDIMSNNGNFLINEKEYSFKNERTNGLLTVTPKGLTIDEAKEGLQQKLTVLLKPDGSVILKDKEKGFIDKKFKRFANCKDKNNAIGFRIAALGNRRYRITTQATKYKKVLSVNNNGALRICRFDPKDKGAVWIIS